MKITGTFIDEITHDIPSANWSAKDWARDFDAMKNIGIDTVIIIRNGYRSQITFESESIKKYTDILPVPCDLVDVFLSEAERCNMSLFFGTYDSGNYWRNGDGKKEIQINKEFADEVISKYGSRKAFKGWYISHEINAYNDTAVNLYIELASHLKNLKDVPIFISPYIKGVKQFEKDAVTLEKHRSEWDKVLEKIKDYIDIIAFQDGNVPLGELKDYIRVNNTLAKKHGLTCWSNVESFDRDVKIKFPPIALPKLLHKIKAAEQARTDKLITFEFSHFMSPNSIYPSAHNLYDRYTEWLERSGQYVNKSGLSLSKKRKINEILNKDSKANAKYTNTK
jgi:hypothetical protein